MVSDSSEEGDPEVPFEADEDASSITSDDPDDPEEVE